MVVIPQKKQMMLRVHLEVPFLVEELVKVIYFAWT